MPSPPTETPSTTTTWSESGPASAEVSSLSEFRSRGPPRAGTPTQHRRRSHHRPRFDGRRGHLRRTGARCGRRRQRHADRSGRGRNCGLPQRYVDGPVRRPLPRIRWRLRVRPEATRGVLGVSRGLGFCRGQNRLVCGDGIGRRRLRMAGSGSRRSGGVGGRPDRGQLHRHSQVGVGDADHRRGGAGNAGGSCR